MIPVSRVGLQWGEEYLDWKFRGLRGWPSPTYYILTKTNLENDISYEIKNQRIHEITLPQLSKITQ